MLIQDDCKIMDKIEIISSIKLTQTRRERIKNICKFFEILTQ